MLYLILDRWSAGWRCSRARQHRRMPSCQCCARRCCGGGRTRNRSWTGPTGAAFAAARLQRCQPGTGGWSACGGGPIPRQVVGRAGCTGRGGHQVDGCQSAPLASHGHTRVPFRRPARNATAGYAREFACHHVGTRAAGMRCRRSRTGGYECRHHSWTTTVTGVNIRRSASAMQFRNATLITLRSI
jgi:hypothetical protein